MGLSPSAAFVIVALLSTVCYATDPPGARRLDPNQGVWVDTKGGKVYVDGSVVLREGVLEMFACPKGTKEHESIVAVDAEAFLVHTALLAIGAEPGSPVKFDPEYEPPSGASIQVEVQWRDADGQQRNTSVQDWVRNIETGTAMELPFVFAGSSIWNDPQTGRQHYLADQGDLICVSNFGTAMLDVPAPSTQANAELLFEPFTERIPPLDTPVRLVLSIAEPPAPNRTPGAGLDRTQEAIATICAARVGAGAEDPLREAWTVLAETPPRGWGLAFGAMEEASPLAANWLRSALAASSSNSALSDEDVVALRAIISDLSFGNLARRTAYELLVEHRPDLRESILETLTDDLDEVLRFQAVGLLLDRAELLEGDAARDAYMEAIAKARVLEQLEEAAQALEGMDAPQSLTSLLGLLTEWRLIGPFDNTELLGYEQVHAPEDVLDAEATYPGKSTEGQKFEQIAWQTAVSSDRLGVIDLNTAIAPEKSAVAYAWTTVSSDTVRDVQLRYSSLGATKLWVNQKLIATHNVYHNGSQFDLVTTETTLREGENQILLKVCQNDQSEPWAQRWQFQLRVCDVTGGQIDGVSIVKLSE